ncbi:MAG: FAD-dependent oxidoreductase [Candidatus Izemoplasmatales bacterium]
MGLFKDIIAIFNKNEIEFIESKKENQDVYTYHFNAEKVKAWKPGQHGIFFIKHKKIHKSIRPFSLASIKQEGVVKISTNIPSDPSEFKQALQTLKPGIPITMRGPVGPLYIRENKPTLLIAGGIGITPHRAIIKDIVLQNQKREPLVLLYIDSKNTHIYKNDLQAFNDHEFIDINFLDNRQDFMDQINHFISTYKNEGRYFISGKKSMVKDIKKHLRKQKIKRKHIFKDIFYGY